MCCLSQRSYFHFPTTPGQIEKTLYAEGCSRGVCRVLKSTELAVVMKTRLGADPWRGLTPSPVPSTPSRRQRLYEAPQGLEAEKGTVP